MGYPTEMFSELTRETVLAMTNRTSDFVSLRNLVESILHPKSIFPEYEIDGLGCGCEVVWPDKSDIVSAKHPFLRTG